MKALSAIIEKIEEYAIVVFLSAMTILTFSQVIARYIFNSGAVWALELTTYFFAWMVLLGTSYLIKHGSHIAVTVFVERFNPRVAKVLTIIAVLCCMIFVIIIFVGAYNYIELLFILEIEMQDLEVQEWIGKLALPIGFALMMFRLIELLFKVIKGEIHSISFAHNQHEK